MSDFVDSKRKTFVAGSDLTNFAYHIGKQDSDGNIIPSTAATDKHIVIIEQNVPSGDQGAQRLIGGDGTFQVQLGAGGCGIGDLLTSDSGGAAVATTTLGDVLIGQALEAGVEDDVVEFLPYKAIVSKIS